MIILNKKIIIMNKMSFSDKLKGKTLNQNLLTIYVIHVHNVRISISLI